MNGYGMSSSNGAILILGWACLAGAVAPGRADDLGLAAGASMDGSTTGATRAASDEVRTTELPVELLGTSASPDEHLAWAAITDREHGEHQLVTLGSEISPGVVVVGIERLRVLLDHEGRLEELVPEGGLRPPDPEREPVRPATPAAAAPVPQPQTESERAKARMQRIMRNPAALYSQARIRPRYEAGAMVGLELSRFKEGSTFEGLGLADGDIVVGFNGRPLASASDGAQFLQQVKMGELSEIQVLGATGEERTLTVGPSD